MPLRAIQISKGQIAKTAAPVENRILPGSIVEYEQHGKPILAAALQEKKGKWAVVNQEGAELELQVARMYLLPEVLPESVKTPQERSAFLQTLSRKTNELETQVDLEALWDVLSEDGREVSIKECAELGFSDNSLLSHLATRRALLNDEVFFKRKKIGFEPRPKNVVEELKVQARVKREREQQRNSLKDAIIRKLRNEAVELPANVYLFEQLAALGRSAEQAKETKELLDEILEELRLPLEKHPEQRAFDLLVRLGRFSPDEDLLPRRMGRPVEFRPEALREVENISAQALPWTVTPREDIRSLYTFTIDGEGTLDFDDALSIEKTPGGYKIGIHISDVSAFLEEESLLDAEAQRRATSVYCPDAVYPMLPRPLSEGLLSLCEGTDRAALSFFLDCSDDFTITNRSISRSLIHVGSRLTYEKVDKLLYGEGTESAEEPLQARLLALWEMTTISEARRIDKGALQFSRREMNAKVLEDGQVLLEASTEETPARKLVSEMMILANETAALFAKDQRFPIYFRGQEAPDTDPLLAALDIPEGPGREYHRRGVLKRSVVGLSPLSHFGLGLSVYTQVTSPIRRYLDLITQRQIVSVLATGRPCYSEEKLREFMALAEAGLDEAQAIQRERNRYFLLRYLEQQKIKELRGTVIRVDGPRPLAEVEVLYCLFPFHRAQAGAAPSEPRKEIGRELLLRIDSIQARTDTLVLREIT